MCEQSSLINGIMNALNTINELNKFNNEVIILDVVS